MAEKINIAELFAGVGGFRLGLEGHPGEKSTNRFNVVFSNQWEPKEKAQWASRIYESRFGSGDMHLNESIETAWKKCPDHHLLVGGFPCQDYSVARTVSGEQGIDGEKGKLWTYIRDLIELRRPSMVFLENVPRLLNSPSKQRGLNFAKILNDFLLLNYDVEWRVINAADYGMPQKRKRVFIIAYSKNPRFNENSDYKFGILNPSDQPEVSDWLTQTGPFAEAFPVSNSEIDILLDLPIVTATQISGDWSKKPSIFEKGGYAYKVEMNNPKISDVTYKFWTFKPSIDYNNSTKTLGSIVEKKFNEKYMIDPSRLDEWRYVKGAKNEFRLRKRDRGNVAKKLLKRYDECMSAPHNKRRKMWQDSEWRKRFKQAVGIDSFYQYDEGRMGFDQLDSPSRTMVTAEIGITPSRMRHIFEYEKGKFRRLMPIEAERLNMFPDNWTLIDGISDSRRGFLMGNALVVGIVERLRDPIQKMFKQ